MFCFFLYYTKLFYLQGDRERKIEGMDVSPMMDRYNATIEKSQVSLRLSRGITYIVEILQKYDVITRHGRSEDILIFKSKL